MFFRPLCPPLFVSLSLHKNCAAVKSVVVWTRRRREKMVRRCCFFRAREMEQNRTDAIAGRDSSRVSVDAEGFALPSSAKFGFFLFFSKVVRGARCDVLDQNARTSAREMWTERASRGMKLARKTRCRTRAHPMRAR